VGGERAPDIGFIRVVQFVRRRLETKKGKRRRSGECACLVVLGTFACTRGSPNLSAVSPMPSVFVTREYVFDEGVWRCVCCRARAFVRSKDGKNEQMTCSAALNAARYRGVRAAHLRGGAATRETCIGCGEDGAGDDGHGDSGP
jgi:hypothetical protein